MSLKIKVPTKLTEITLKQYQKYLVIHTRTDLSDQVRWMETVSVICDLDREKVKIAELSQLQEIYIKITELLNDPGSSEEPFKNIFKIKGASYGFIPDFRAMSAGEFTDLDTYITDEKMIPNIHKIMAILFRPVISQVKKLYTISDYNKEADWSRQHRQAILQKYMTVDYVRGMSVFFSDSVMKLSNSSKKEQSKSQAQKTKQEIPGDG